MNWKLFIVICFSIILGYLNYMVEGYFMAGVNPMVVNIIKVIFVLITGSIIYMIFKASNEKMKLLYLGIFLFSMAISYLLIWKDIKEFQSQINDSNLRRYHQNDINN